MVVDTEKLPNPFQAALASALAFSVGAVIPLLAAAFIRNYKIRLVVVAVVELYFRAVELYFRAWNCRQYC